MSTDLFHSSGAVQVPLFDFGADLPALQERRKMLQSAVRSPRTMEVYRISWAVFVGWCVTAGRPSLPASADTVSLFCSSEIQVGLRLATVRLRLAAVAWHHRAAGFAVPVDDSVRRVLEGAARQLCERPAGKAALSADVLRLAAEKFLSSGSHCAVRDLAVVLLGFASGWRRSELAALQVADVRFVREGLRLYQAKSKTDQEGNGRHVGIPFGAHASTCPVKAVRAWLSQRGSAPGPLFVRSFGLSWTSEPLHPESVSQLLKRVLERVGEDSSKYGAHSLRAGCITAAAESGADLPAIMQRTGHASVAVVMGYIRPASVFRNDPLAGVL